MLRSFSILVLSTGNEWTIIGQMAKTLDALGISFNKTLKTILKYIQTVQLCLGISYLYYYVYIYPEFKNSP